MTVGSTMIDQNLRLYLDETGDHKSTDPTEISKRYLGLCGWLSFMSKHGDVFAESRGGTEDSNLKDAFRAIHTLGSYYLPASRCQATLTSKHIKIKPKVLNIAGLQLADLLAHPLARDVLRNYGHLFGYESPFQSEMIKIAGSKYNRQIYSGQINGYGRVFLD